MKHSSRVNLLPLTSNGRLNCVVRKVACKLACNKTIYCRCSGTSVRAAHTYLFFYLLQESSECIEETIDLSQLRSYYCRVISLPRRSLPPQGLGFLIFPIAFEQRRAVDSLAARPWGFCPPWPKVTLWNAVPWRHSDTFLLPLNSPPIVLVVFFAIFLSVRDALTLGTVTGNGVDSTQLTCHVLPCHYIYTHDAGMLLL